jgi:hypothetical protein
MCVFLFFSCSENTASVHDPLTPDHDSCLHVQHDIVTGTVFTSDSVCSIVAADQGNFIAGWRHKHCGVPQDWRQEMYPAHRRFGYNVT